MKIRGMRHYGLRNAKYLAYGLSGTNMSIAIPSRADPVFTKLSG